MVLARGITVAVVGLALCFVCPHLVESANEQQEFSTTYTTTTVVVEFSNSKAHKYVWLTTDWNSCQAYRMEEMTSMVWFVQINHPDKAKVKATVVWKGSESDVATACDIDDVNREGLIEIDCLAKTCHEHPLKEEVWVKYDASKGIKKKEMTAATLTTSWAANADGEATESSMSQLRDNIWIARRIVPVGHKDFRAKLLLSYNEGKQKVIMSSIPLIVIKRMVIP